MTREQLERIKDEAAAKGRALTADEGLAAATGTSDFAKAQRGAPMTPAEIAAAKILAAWNEWPGTNDAAHIAGNSTDIEQLLLRIAGCLEDAGLVRHDADAPAAEGLELLLRARANGHLP